MKLTDENATIPAHYRGGRRAHMAAQADGQVAQRALHERCLREARALPFKDADRFTKFVATNAWT